MVCGPRPADAIEEDPDMSGERSATTPAKNRLLGALPEAARRRLDRTFQAVELETGTVLNEPGDRLRQAFFPDSGVISVVNLMRGGRAIEVGTIGREGMSGASALLGVDFVPYRYIVQVPGSGWRMKTADLLEAARPDTPLWRLLMRYSVAFTSQVMQSVACAGLHSIDERCCRWLLTTRDSVDSDRFSLTHEFLALMLGTRRTSVSQVLKRIQNDGLINYRRGTITIVNRRGLEARACECYRSVTDLFRRILGEPG